MTITRRTPGGAPGVREWIPFLMGMALVVAVVPLYLDPTLEGPLAPLTDATARSARLLLEMTGVGAVWDGRVLSKPDGFGFRVIYRCTGLLPSLFLVVGILSSPGRLKLKLSGVALGVPMILALNQVRLVHLLHFGSQRPEQFDLVHHVVWEAVIVAAVFGIWLGWVLWANPTIRRGSRRVPVHPHSPGVEPQAA